MVNLGQVFSILVHNESFTLLETHLEQKINQTFFKPLNFFIKNLYLGKFALVKNLEGTVFEIIQNKKKQKHGISKRNSSVCASTILFDDKILYNC